MRAKRFHGLKRLKFRQTWNKYNLYNLSRLRKPFIAPLTYFQQKWFAKRATRAYHGEHIRERKWETMFTSRIKSVIPMDHRYLAAQDGSEQAQGRGSGLEQIRPKNLKESIPYMQMAYAPLERRLDTVIFRALFASSTRQARQFVIHGAVRVNGKKMIHPGYLLNPGDMFQVDPDRVLFATGAPKGRARRRRRRRAKVVEKIVDGEGADGAPVGERSNTSATPMSAQEMTQDISPKFEGSLARKPGKSKMEKLLENAKTVVEDNNSETFTKRKQALGEFTRSIRPVINKINTKTVDAFEKPPSSILDDQLNAILAELSLSSKGANQESSNMKKSQPIISKGDRKILLGALQEAYDNPIDDSKPYLTPWRPRPYMSAFAFIPRYLEVNQNICSAVYLRHPVARPGLAEIPTPFAQETNQLAFNWYLRRR